MFLTVTKRSGTTVPFESDKIEEALFRCFMEQDAHVLQGYLNTLIKNGRAYNREEEIPEGQRIVCGKVLASNLTAEIEKELIKNAIIAPEGALEFLFSPGKADEELDPIYWIGSVEDVQDVIERCLIRHEFHTSIRHYMLFRDHKRLLRANAPVRSESEMALIESGANSFPLPTQMVTYLSKYAKWIPGKQRREVLPETAARYFDFMQSRPQIKGKIPGHVWKELETSLLNLEAMPSMRLMQMAGPAAERCNVSGYNCAAIGLDCWDAFAELLYILMQGTGCGFSVERAYIDELPSIPVFSGAKPTRHVVKDSTEGWCNAFREGLELWGQGLDVTFDYRHIRAKGVRLKTKGGRASGPEPLKKLLDFTRDIFLRRQGERLQTIDAHDIACMSGAIVQVGGVRRAAEISVFDADDEAMLHAKDGMFWERAEWRSMANNSIGYKTKPTREQFFQNWQTLVESHSGEPGIWNSWGAQETRPIRRPLAHFLPNPCGEIMLRDTGQFCNLSIAVARVDDTIDTLIRKVRHAAIFGTLQSALTDFAFLRPVWTENCREERLLGVDITGQMDCPLLRYGAPGRAELLKLLRLEAVLVNQMIAEALGIPASTAVTCVKPSGNSGQLLNASSGLHPRYAKFYIRRMLLGSTDGVAHLLRDAGVPVFPYDNETLETSSNWSFEFPVAAPEGAVTRHDLTALQQFENWKEWKRNYTEHNPSVTIYVKEGEWEALGEAVYRDWNIVGGLSFLPSDDHVYRLAPYEEITEDEYFLRSAAFPSIDWTKLPRYDREDTTEMGQDYACVSGGCDL